MKRLFYHKIISSVVWNLILITAGALVFATNLKSIAIPKGFITGGVSALTLLIYYVSVLLSPGLWYLLVNIPIFLVEWLHVSRRFFFDSLGLRDNLFQPAQDGDHHLRSQRNHRQCHSTAARPGRDVPKRQLCVYRQGKAGYPDRGS
jgi:hypothetical protein